MYFKFVVTFCFIYYRDHQIALTLALSDRVCTSTKSTPKKNLFCMYISLLRSIGRCFDTYITSKTGFTLAMRSEM